MTVQAIFGWTRSVRTMVAAATFGGHALGQAERSPFAFVAWRDARSCDLLVIERDGACITHGFRCTRFERFGRRGTMPATMVLSIAVGFVTRRARVRVAGACVSFRPERTARGA